MNERKTDVAVIGAGSAGLAAFREALRHTDNVLLVDPGPLGTTCARSGCMPSKALIHVAGVYYRRRYYNDAGIMGAGMLISNLPTILEHVRQVRDRFVEGMQQTTRELAGDRLISARAELLDENRIRAGAEMICAKHIILAVGAKPVVPDDWKRFGRRVLTSQTIFEQDTLPRRMAVIGLGPVGLELGQAFSRLGVEVTGFSSSNRIGGLSDPEVHAEAVRQIEQEFPLFLGDRAAVDELENGRLRVQSGTADVETDAILAATGIAPALDGLGLETLGVEPKDLSCDPYTGQIGDRPVYVVGDANGIRPILHEALDEGAQAAAHALGADAESCRCRRVPLSIVFSDPEIVVVGTPHRELPDGTVTGAAVFDEQARAVMEYRNAGRLHVYAEQGTGLLRGAELCVPDAESFGHLLALAIQRQCTVWDLLQMPFYHPTLMEGLRTALRDAAEQCEPASKRNAHVRDWCCAETPLG